MSDLNSLLGPIDRRFTIDDLVFNGTSSDADGGQRQPHVYARRPDGERDRQPHSSRPPIATLPPPFTYSQTAWGNLTDRHYGKADGVPPPELVEIILRAMQAGYEFGVEAGRDQVAQLLKSLLTNGPKP